MTNNSIVSTREEAERVRRRFMAYPAVNSVREDLERLFTFGDVGHYSRASARTYMLVGDPGSGKTAVLKMFCRKHPQVFEADRDVHPALYVEVPPRATRKALAARILSELGALVPSSSTENTLTARVLGHLRDQGVKVLVLDEAQHLMIPEKQQLNYEAADWVKAIVNDGNCSVVLSGVSDAWVAYLYNGQLRRRSYGNQRLRALRVSDSREWSTFIDLLQEYEKELLPALPADLSDRLTALRIHRQVSGLVGRLADFISDALIFALEKGFSNLTEEVLWEVAERQSDLGDVKWVNPFDMTEATLLEAAEKEDGYRRSLGCERSTAVRRGTRAVKQKDVLS